MILSNILLGAVILFFGIRLLCAIREKQKGRNKIRLISKQTGQILELNPEQMAHLISKTMAMDFTDTAKEMFKLITEAFAKGHLSEVKRYLSDKVLPIFQEAIDLRQTNKQKMEFTLIGFKEVKLLEDLPNKKVVSFISEQINLLKDDQNKVVEGDPLYVATVTENWTFTKEQEERWVLSAIQHKEGHFA